MTEWETDRKKMNWMDLILSLQIPLNVYAHYNSQSFQGLCISLAINERAQQLEESSLMCSNKTLLSPPPRLKGNPFLLWFSQTGLKVSVLLQLLSSFWSAEHSRSSVQRWARRTEVLLKSPAAASGRKFPEMPLPRNFQQEWICVSIHPENSIHYIHMQQWLSAAICIKETSLKFSSWNSVSFAELQEQNQSCVGKVMI